MWIQIQDKIVNLNKVQYIEVNNNRLDFDISDKEYIPFYFKSNDELNAAVMRLNTAIECVNLDVKPPIESKHDEYKKGDNLKYCGE